MSNTVSTQSLPTDEGSGSGGSQRRLLMVVGGAALLLVLGLGAYFLFLSGGEEEEAAFAPIPRPTATDDAGGKKDKGDEKDDTVPAEVDSDFTVGRDPFLPLAVEEVVVVEEPADDAGDTGTDPGTDTSGGTGDGKPVPAPAPTSSPKPAPTPTQDEVTSWKVTLKSVNVRKDSAVFEVNGKRYVVKVKEMFTNSKTGPFQLTWIGQEQKNGKDAAKVMFVAVPYQLVAKDTVDFPQ